MSLLFTRQCLSFGWDKPSGCRGGDVTVISTGGMLMEAVETAERLEALDGIHASVVSMPTIKPLDAATVIEAAHQSGAVVTAEEHSVTGGLGSAVAEVLAESGLTVRFKRFGVPDRLNHTVGSQTYLRRTAGDLRQVVLSLLRSSTEERYAAAGQRR